MNLIVGLGNIGTKYEITRHNVGFMCLDYYIREYVSNLNFENNFSAQIAKIDSVLFIKPQTYMNNSGLSLKSICSFYKIDSIKDNILVIQDDLDLEFGKIRIKFAGGSGGHNGIKSIDTNIGKNYFRLKIGIGRPSNDKINDISALESKASIVDYVLSDFMKSEIDILNDMIFLKAANLINDFISNTPLIMLQNKYNG